MESELSVDASQLARASAGPGVLTRKAALSRQTGGTRTAGKGEGTDRVPGRPQGAVGRERVPAARPGSRHGARRRAAQASDEADRATLAQIRSG